MKMNIKKYAGMLLAVAGLFVSSTLEATNIPCKYPTWLDSYVSSQSKTRHSSSTYDWYCKSYFKYNCRSVSGRSDSNCYDNNYYSWYNWYCGSWYNWCNWYNYNNCGGGTTTPPVVGTVSISPAGTIEGIGTTITITVPYTAPANSGAQITLFEDEIAIATYTVPTYSTSGNATFSIAVPSYLDVTVFQAQLTYTTTTVVKPDGDCRKDRDRNRDCDRGRTSHHYRGDRDCDDEDDNDCNTGTPVTNVLTTDYLIVVKPGGGGQSG